VLGWAQALVSTCQGGSPGASTVVGTSVPTGIGSELVMELVAGEGSLTTAAAVAAEEEAVTAEPRSALSLHPVTSASATSATRKFVMPCRERPIS